MRTPTPWLCLPLLLLAAAARADTVCLPTMSSCPGMPCGLLQQVPCQLANGCQGMRQCLADGSGYGACGCTGAGPGPACVNSCSGASGRQQCDQSCTPRPACVVGGETRNCCDDDGDGLIDEGLPLGCTTACGGPGAWQCTSSGPRCVGTETCNNCDDDADGRVDNVRNTATPLSRACSDPSGVCGGSQTCTAGQWSACGCATLGSCASVPGCAAGACRESTVATNQCNQPPRGALCSASCTPLAYCVPSEPPETCNGVDDDCDGEVDPRTTCDQSSPCCPASCAEAGVTCGTLNTSCGPLDCGKCP